MTRPDCVTTVLAILADRDVWAEDRRALEAYVIELEAKVDQLRAEHLRVVGMFNEATASGHSLAYALGQAQAREAYLREVLEAQPRRLTTVWKDGIDLELPDYATRLRDQALAAPQDRTALDEQIARAREEGAHRALLRLAAVVESRKDGWYSITADEVRAYLDQPYEPLP